jgi:hypothetical protein
MVLDQFIRLFRSGGPWRFGLADFEFGGGAFEIQFQEAFEDLVGGEAVGGGDDDQMLPC